jgi:hypothetical protein
MAKYKKIDRSKLIAEFIKYIKINSKRIENYNVWCTYPVCVQDIAVTHVCADDNHIYFGDYDDKSNIFNCRHIDDEVDTRFLDEVFEDIKMIDTKNKRR